MLDDAQKLMEIIQLGSELNSVQDLDILLEKILREARKILYADAGSIQIREGDELVFSHVQTESLEQNLPYVNFRTKINKQSVSGYAASTGEMLNIADAYIISANAPYRFDPTNDKKTNYRTKSMLTIPLKNNRNEILGVMQIINSIKPDKVGKSYLDDDSVGFFDSNDELIALHFANIASMILQRAQMTRALILRMISMAELRDPKETGSHVNRVASYSVEIYEKWAQKKRLSKDEIEKNRDILRMAAMLHDVGKVAISDLILKKPARFTEEEFEIMKTHTIHGARLFKAKQSEFDEIAAQVALTHHENWDGTGYPGHIDIETGEPGNQGSQVIKGEEIPIYGRIVALADVYDALSSKRVYKDAWGEKEVLDEIRKMSGTKFDPELVAIFFETIDLLRSIQQRYPDHE